MTTPTERKRIKTMKTTVTEYTFRKAFEDCRPNNFSHAGLGALFDWFEEYEAGSGEELELDVIAICCDFSEYADVQEFIADYGDKYSPEEYGDDEEFRELLLEELQDHTQVIDVDGTAFIIQSF